MGKPLQAAKAGGHWSHCSHSKEAEEIDHVLDSLPPAFQVWDSSTGAGPACILGGFSPLYPTQRHVSEAISDQVRVTVAISRQNYSVLCTPGASDTSLIITDGSPALVGTYNTSLIKSLVLKHTFMLEEGVIHCM